MIRFKFIDGLRGIAASAVMFHHLLHASVLEVALRGILPGIVLSACTFGAFGVQVFFVISGFVIAHTLKDMKTIRENIGFIIRRQVRLDPPYWAAVFMTIILFQARRFVRGLANHDSWSVRDVMLNLAYLHKIVGAKEILPVAWTLCLEIQFYLVAMILFCCLWRHREASSNRSNWGFFLLAVLSLILYCLWSVEHNALDHSAWFIHYWFFFAAGGLVYMSQTDRTSKFMAIILCVLIAIAFFVSGDYGLLAAVVTATAMYLAISWGKLGTWFDWPVLQFLGRISYSLYITHLLVVMTVLPLGYKLTGAAPWPALMWFILTAFICVVSAYLLYRTVERPSMRLGETLKRRFSEIKVAAELKVS